MKHGFSVKIPHFLCWVKTSRWHHPTLEALVQLWVSSWFRLMCLCDVCPVTKGLLYQSPGPSSSSFALYLSQDPSLLLPPNSFFFFLFPVSLLSSSSSFFFLARVSVVLPSVCDVSWIQLCVCVCVRKHITGWIGRLSWERGADGERV